MINEATRREIDRIIIEYTPSAAGRWSRNRRLARLMLQAIDYGWCGMCHSVRPLRGMNKNGREVLLRCKRCVAAMVKPYYERRRH